MAGFGELVDDLDTLVMKSLSDGAATYRPPQIGAGEKKGIPVIIDRNLEVAGAGEVFQTSLVGVTWRCACLKSVEAGGVFLFGSERLLVQRVIADDGDWMTAACMVQP
ncbi:hypothetical protein [Aquipseudomonas alcaligenes]|uniref:Uncharacterized protein n=1 Tax=Aquipseudomonas alcaligenes TaxID=43263 RepID=A0AA42SSS2_AQUAC|nr:hypothetical protein [Pseudomonas alcaligenes]MDH1055303.1 hypothetical protein [Pseudomonas alcaligenes]